MTPRTEGETLTVRDVERLQDARSKNQRVIVRQWKETPEVKSPQSDFAELQERALRFVEGHPGCTVGKIIRHCRGSGSRLKVAVECLIFGGKVKRKLRGTRWELFATGPTAEIVLD